MVIFKEGKEPSWFTHNTNDDGQSHNSDFENWVRTCRCFSTDVTEDGVAYAEFMIDENGYDIAFRLPLDALKQVVESTENGLAKYKSDHKPDDESSSGQEGGA